MNWKNFKLGTKLSVGFGGLILISVILGGIAVKNMSKITRESKVLDQEYIPEVKMSTDLREVVNRAMYAMRGYEFTENETFYNNALKEIEAIKNVIASGEELEKNSKRLIKLSQELKVVKELTDQYEIQTRQSFETINKLKLERNVMDENASKYLDNCEKYFNSHSNSGANLYQLVAMKKIMQLIYQLRIADFKSQTAHDPKILEDALLNFSVLNESIDNLRNHTTDAKDLQSLTLILESGRRYQSATENFSKLLVESQKMSQQRDVTGQKLRFQQPKPVWKER